MLFQSMHHLNLLKVAFIISVTYGETEAQKSKAFSSASNIDIRRWNWLRIWALFMTHQCFSQIIFRKWTTSHLLCDTQCHMELKLLSFARAGFGATYVRWDADNCPLCTTPWIGSVHANLSFTKIQKGENIRFDLNVYLSGLLTYSSLLLRLRNEPEIRNHNCLCPPSLTSAIGQTQRATLTLPYFPGIRGSYSLSFLHGLSTLFTMFSQYMVDDDFGVHTIILHCIATPSETRTVYRLNSIAPGT